MGPISELNLIVLLRKFIGREHLDEAYVGFASDNILLLSKEPCILLSYAVKRDRFLKMMGIFGTAQYY